MPNIKVHIYVCVCVIMLTDVCTAVTPLLAALGHVSGEPQQNPTKPGYPDATLLVQTVDARQTTQTLQDPQVVEGKNYRTAWHRTDGWKKGKTIMMKISKYTECRSIKT